MRFSIHIGVILIITLLFLASLTSLYFALGNEQTAPLILVAAANIAAVILFTFLITRGIIQPLKHIRAIMKEVTQGDLSRRVALRATKEMEEVGEAFNTMITKLSKTRQEVEDSNKALEHRVKERTQQLQELTSSLEERVQERTKEFKEKVEELERFQKLAVGRELRMVELKDKIHSLEERLFKQQPSYDAAARKKRKSKND